MFVISGPGGVGKSTIARELVRRDASLTLSRSWTTRGRRAGEDAEAYTFVSRNQFEENAARGGFLEWAEFAGNLYGTPNPVLGPGEDLLLEIDIQGARQVRAKDPSAVVFLIASPSWDATAERLRLRGDDAAAIARRLEIGRREEEQGRAFCDHVVVNDDLDATLEKLAGIIAAHRRQEV